jgi:cell division protein FtsZ
LNAVQGISDLMTVPGLINVDFADVRTIMSGMGRALMGTGVGTGKRRATEAAEMAISSPLLEDVSIDGATGILINITGGPDLTLHEVNEASSLIQHAAHEDANIIFGSVIDPNLSEEVRITVIATGFNGVQKVIAPEPMLARASTPPPLGHNQRQRLSNAQIQIPYDVSTQVTKDYPYPAPVAARRPAAQVVEEPEIDIAWAQPELAEVNAIEQTLAELSEPVPANEFSARMANGSGPLAPVDGTPLIQPDRKRAQSRPSMKAVLSGEIDTDNELDVPTFIRRHNTHQ